MSSAGERPAPVAPGPSGRWRDGRRPCHRERRAKKVTSRAPGGTVAAVTSVAPTIQAPTTRPSPAVIGQPAPGPNSRSSGSAIGATGKAADTCRSHVGSASPGKNTSDTKASGSTVPVRDGQRGLRARHQRAHREAGHRERDDAECGDDDQVRQPDAPDAHVHDGGADDEHHEHGRRTDDRTGRDAVLIT